MTGGYVDSHDLDKMLKTPTRKMAESCLYSQLIYWFQVGTEDMGGDYSGKMPIELVSYFPRIRDIAEDYGCDI